MAALATHVRQHPAGSSGDFDRHYSGRFKDMYDRRSVLFLTPGSRAEFERTQVPVRFQRDIFTSEEVSGGSWKPSFINGPTGSGKSCFGIFGLTTPEQLLVRIAAPPPFHTPRGAGLSRGVSACIMEAERLMHAQEAYDARHCYTDAMCAYIQELLEARIGKRTGVAADQAVETIFFFDDFNALDARGCIGRTAARGLVGDRSRFKELLQRDFGLKLHSIAMVGTGFELQADASIMCAWNYFRSGTAQWRYVTDKPSLPDEEASAHVTADLDAVLRLPRLAALVLQFADDDVDDVIRMDFLHLCLRPAIGQFTSMGALSGRVEDTMQRRALSVQCVRFMLFPCKLGPEEVAHTTSSLVAEFGLAAPVPDVRAARDYKYVIQIGAAQRLVLRHVFEQSHFPRPFYMSAFKTAVTHFLLLAVSGSDGKTLSEFVSALNAFFAHSAQHRPDGHCRVSRPTVTVTDCLAKHVLRVKDAEMACLDEPKTIEVPPGAAVVVVNEFHGDLPWDVQLVLPVTAPGSDDVEHATFSVEMIPCLTVSFAEAQFDALQVKAAAAPAVVPGAQHAGYAAVVGSLQRQGRINERGAPMWHVNTRNPDCLGVVPVLPGSTDLVN